MAVATPRGCSAADGGIEQALLAGLFQGDVAADRGIPDVQLFADLNVGVALPLEALDFVHQSQRGTIEIMNLNLTRLPIPPRVEFSPDGPGLGRAAAAPEERRPNLRPAAVARLAPSRRCSRSDYNCRPDLLAMPRRGL
jgi:hypothetical protein